MISLLVGVWGRAYVEGFLELSLASLLAPGNLAALARARPCTFTFLTTPTDEDTIRAHPMFARLEALCPVRFVEISDLVFPGNHSTTLTLAYERGMRATGTAMTSTYFIYLVSDYVMADGSLAALVPHLERGVSGITSGNFQIVEEETRAHLLARRSSLDGSLAIPPRDLCRYALAHLHPVTLGSTVIGGAITNGHANRLFWRSGAGSLVGRFWLRHMLCIKPETDTFRIGSSCDYSFIPEMCPSGNVVALTDSDDFFVVELQPAAHEGRFLRPRPLRPVALASDLSEWTTADHRRNIDVATVFHAGDLDDEVRETIAESRREVDAIKPLLEEEPQPVRDHPYWKGAVRLGRDGLIGALQDRLVGRVPAVNRWHHRWQDFGPLMEHLEESRAKGRRVLAVQTGPHPCSFWLTRNHPRGTTFLHPERLLGAAMEPIDVAYFFIDPVQRASLAASVDQVATSLSPGGEIVVHLENDGRDLAAIASSVSRALRRARVVRAHFAGSRFRRHADGLRTRLAQVKRPIAMACLAALQLAYRVDNELAGATLAAAPDASSCTLFIERRP